MTRKKSTGNRQAGKGRLRGDVGNLLEVASLHYRDGEAFHSQVPGSVSRARATCFIFASFFLFFAFVRTFCPRLLSFESRTARAFLSFLGVFVPSVAATTRPPASRTWEASRLQMAATRARWWRACVRAPLVPQLSQVSRPDRPETQLRRSVSVFSLFRAIPTDVAGGFRGRLCQQGSEPPHCLLLLRANFGKGQREREREKTASGRSRSLGDDGEPGRFLQR